MRGPSDPAGLILARARPDRTDMAGAGPVRRYIVAATPRTGSYLLCEGLEATGIAGRPAEFFAPDLWEHWCRHWGIGTDVSFFEYYNSAVLYGTTGNGVFGMKIHQMHLQALAYRASFTDNHFNNGMYDVLEYNFPDAAYIQTVRSDRRAQAISYYRALATNEWVRLNTEEEQRQDYRLAPNTVGTPAFGADAIRALEADLAQQGEAWQQYFRECDIVPLVIDYETLAEHYRETIGRVLTFLGLPAHAAETIPPPRLVRQADKLTESWRSRLDAADCAES
jgi:trehalose 2-sulfotransferase